MEKKITLVVVDFQYDFCLLGGSLYVPGSDKALWNIHNLLTSGKVGEVVFTVDWHSPTHCSFIQNDGKWPMHCLQFSKGAAVHELLLQECINQSIPYSVVKKGEVNYDEEYGAFSELTEKNGTYTGHTYTDSCKFKNPMNIVICGLAGDYCVLETLKNLRILRPSIYLNGIASIDGGKALDTYISLHNTPKWE